MDMAENREQCQLCYHFLPNQNDRKVYSYSLTLFFMLATAALFSFPIHTEPVCVSSLSVAVCNSMKKAAFV